MVVLPICLGYDQSHFEALVPDTEDDIRKTILLKKEILSGNYSYKFTDVFPENNQDKNKGSLPRVS